MGVLGALDCIATAQRLGLQLMMGGMVEARIGMGFSAHLAAGTGVFAAIDLDTPLLMAEDPVRGGYTVHGCTYRLDGGYTGAGIEL